MKYSTLYEGKLDNIREFLRSRFQPVEGADKFEDFFNQIIAADPTGSNYVQWIGTRMLENPQDNRIEDLQRLKGDIQKFLNFRTRIPELKQYDINRLKTFQDVYKLIEPHIKSQRNKQALKRRRATIDAKHRANIIDVYRGSEGWIRIPKTKGASQYLGRGTRWCTAATKQNQFDFYNKSGPLVVVYDKATNEKWTIHIERGGIVQSDDSTVNGSCLPEWSKPLILQWMAKNKDKLDFNQTLKLSQIGDVKDLENVDPNVLELLDMMKRYDV